MLILRFLYLLRRVLLFRWLPREAAVINSRSAYNRSKILASFSLCTGFSKK